MQILNRVTLPSFSKSSLLNELHVRTDTTAVLVLSLPRATSEFVPVISETIFTTTSLKQPKVVRESLEISSTTV
jgi:hypothetical protein